MTITTIRANLLQTLALVTRTVERGAKACWLAVIGGLVGLNVSILAIEAPSILAAVLGLSGIAALLMPADVGRTPIKKPLERANALTANREKHCASSLTATAEVRQ